MFYNKEKKELLRTLRLPDPSNLKGSLDELIGKGWVSNTKVLRLGEFLVGEDMLEEEDKKGITYDMVDFPIESFPVTSFTDKKTEDWFNKSSDKRDKRSSRSDKKSKRKKDQSSTIDKDLAIDPENSFEDFN